MKILQYILSVITSLLFTFLIVIIHYESDNVQLLLSELQWLSFDIAPYFVRTFVGFCWALCLFSVLPTSFRKTSLKIIFISSTIIFIVVGYVYFFKASLLPIYFSSFSFIGYLIAPFIVMLLTVLSLWLYSDVVWKKLSKKVAVILAISFIAVGVAASFAMNPVVSSSRNKNVNAKLLLPLNNLSVVSPQIDISKGKQIVAIMSYTCPHCLIAAKKFRILQKLHLAIPIKVVLAGKEAKRKLFFNKTGMQEVPNYTLINDAIFWQLALNSIPAIYLVNNGLVEKRIHHSNISEKELMNWLNE